MQLTLHNKQRLVDTFFVAISVCAALFSIAAISTAIVSPWIAHVTGDWSGVFPAVAIGVLGPTWPGSSGRSSVRWSATRSCAGPSVATHASRLHSVWPTR